MSNETWFVTQQVNSSLSIIIKSKVLRKTANYWKHFQRKGFKIIHENNKKKVLIIPPKHFPRLQTSFPNLPPCLAHN